MEIIFAVLCFLNGLALGAGVMFLRGRGAHNEGVDEEAQQRGSMAAQVENFLNYDGTSRGQRYIDER